MILLLLAAAGVLVTSSLAGYAFARLRFPARERLFLAYIGTMMIPGQVTLVPLYLMITKLKLVNTFAGVILPGLADVIGSLPKALRALGHESVSVLNGGLARRCGLLHDIGKIVLGTVLEVDAAPIVALAFDHQVSFEEAERKAREEAERRAREEAERKAREEAERKARVEAERRAREEAERRARECYFPGVRGKCGGVFRRRSSNDRM